MCFAHFSQCSVFHGFHKDQISVCFAQHHDVYVALAGHHRELSCLVSEHYVFHVLNVNTYLSYPMLWHVNHMYFRPHLVLYLIVLLACFAVCVFFVSHLILGNIS